MQKLLYIGNNLNTANSNVTSIQSLGAQLKKEGYQVKYASSIEHKLGRLFHMIWSCIRYSKWVDTVLIDTYSTQNFYYAFFCSQLCRILRIPYIPILHGGNLPERLVNNPRLSNLIFKHSKVNVSPSLYLYSEFSSKGYDIAHIPNSIDLKKYDLRPKNYEAVQLLWVRSFSKIYNPEMAIHVAKLLNDTGYNVTLCMIGPDVDGRVNQCKTLAKSLGVHVQFTGKLSKKDWIERSHRCNIFINTTNFDNMPLSVIEAMALGFPIVSTNAGGLPFLIEHNVNGLLVSKDDKDAMANAIIRLINDQDLRTKLSKNARSKAETYDWSLIKSQWKGLL